ncbi:hypothetical protein, partial [Carboxylicivirga taeanensis]|uniref:hypothetical protein n=1 Tax=Carboxylicivirga taeanensis TaxID=1416875 RepID=UPI003F6E3CED
LSLRIDKCLKPLSILPFHEYHCPQKRVQNKEVFCEYANSNKEKIHKKAALQLTLLYINTLSIKIKLLNSILPSKSY